MYCAHCGNSLEDSARFCSSCGKPVAGPTAHALAALPATPVAPATPASALRCPQCGRFSPSGSHTCDCGYDFRTATNPRGTALTLFPVATHKFIVLSLCSFSIYELYWFYQNWKRIRDSSREAISPFWRAAFGVFWAIPLFRRIRRRAEASGLAVGWSAGALGTLFIILSILWRLPDPWWLISFGSLVALVPVVQTCQQINVSAQNPEGLNNEYTTANVATIVIGGLLLVLSVIETVNPGWAG